MSAEVRPASAAGTPVPEDDFDSEPEPCAWSMAWALQQQPTDELFSKRADELFDKLTPEQEAKVRSIIAGVPWLKKPRRPIGGSNFRGPS